MKALSVSPQMRFDIDGSVRFLPMISHENCIKQMGSKDFSLSQLFAMNAAAPKRDAPAADP